MFRNILDLASFPTRSGLIGWAAMVPLVQSTTYMYVSFHTHGPSLWLNCARLASPDFASMFAAECTFWITSWGVAFSCATANCARLDTRRVRPRTAETLSFISILLDCRLARPEHVCRN